MEKIVTARLTTIEVAATKEVDMTTPSTALLLATVAALVSAEIAREGDERRDELAANEALDEARRALAELEGGAR